MNPAPYFRALRDLGLTRLEVRPTPGGISTYRGGRYCGPGWGFVKEDVLSGRIKEMPAALDAIDDACRRHDQCYFDHGWLTAKCNVALARDLVKVVFGRGSTPQQRYDAAVMASVFAAEVVSVDWVVAGVRSAADTPRQMWQEFQAWFNAHWSMEAVINNYLNNPWYRR